MLGIARVEAEEGRFKDALKHCYESFCLHWELGRTHLIGQCLECLAVVAEGLADHERAARFLGAAKKEFDDNELWSVPGLLSGYKLRLKIVTRLKAGERDRLIEEGAAWNEKEVSDNVSNFYKNWI